MRLRVNSGALDSDKTLVTGSVSFEEFCTRVIEFFPELRDEFSHLADIPMLRMTAFSRHVQEAKGAADWDGYQKGIGLVDAVWPKADTELERRIKRSFLAHIDFDGPRGSTAWEYLSPELRHAWTAVNNAREALRELPRKVKSTKRKRQ